MSKELINVELNNDGFITSVELVGIINHFREEEFNILNEKGINNKDNVSLLMHKSFMTKIKKELEVDKTLILDKDVIKCSYKDKQNKEQPCYKLNKYAINILSEKSKGKDKFALKKIYETIGGEEYKILCVDRFEDTFFNKLNTILSVMGVYMERQYIVEGTNYRIDGYIPEYNLALEYDEQQHNVEPQKTKDINREYCIKNKINCRFIRLNYKDSDYYNIGTVIRELFSSIKYKNNEDILNSIIDDLEYNNFFE